MHTDPDWKALADQRRRHATIMLEHEADLTAMSVDSKALEVSVGKMSARSDIIEGSYTRNA